MEECLFCKWKNEKEKIILENELAFARYDEFAVSKGHILIMTKRHTKDFFSTTKEEKDAIFELLNKVKEFIDEKYNPDGYNIGMNCGVPAGQSVMHVHVHLIPRYNGDVENPRGGIREYTILKLYDILIEIKILIFSRLGG